MLSPDLTTIYGKWSHKELKYQEFSKCFKEAKKQLRIDKKTDKLRVTGLEEVDETETADSGIITLSNPRTQDWQSAKGKTISAKLVRIEKDSTFVFKTKTGKEIKVTEQQLSPGSVITARELAADES